MKDVVELTSKGLYCRAGDFYIDPWAPVRDAIITHGHADHARVGAENFFCTRSSEAILRHRLGAEIQLQAHDYGKPFQLNDALISFHPAGHVLGSAQVRVEVDGEVWVVSGDYKRSPDSSCEAFEVVPCDTFISEATFGLPVYAWPSTREVAKEIYTWWSDYKDGPSVLFAYAFGKTQRILSELGHFTDRPVYLHGACRTLTEIYRQHGIKMVPTELVSEQTKENRFEGDLILAPPSAHRSAWMKRFKNPQTAFASGWMQIRGNRRRRGYERGFVLSDHADWKDLVSTILATGASRVLLTHGNTDALERYLREEKGIQCEPLATKFEGETEA